MRRAVCQHSQNKFYFLPIQRAEIYIDRIILTFINFIPLTKGLDRPLTDLVLKLVYHVAVIGFVHTVDPSLKTIAGLDCNIGVFSRDQTISDSLREGHQTFVWGGAAIFHFGRILNKHITSVVAI